MKIKKAYFAGGCFWCLEAAFSTVPGVTGVISGYAGGSKEKPTYEDVSAGVTGHAETVEVSFDPKVVKYQDILDLFFRIHDPSQNDRQGSDVGTQYRSVIFYTSEEQKVKADKYLNDLKEAGIYIVVYTDLLPLEKFWPAEEYHQKYFEKHPDQAYCQLVVRPKVAKAQEYVKEHYGD